MKCFSRQLLLVTLCTGLLSTASVVRADDLSQVLADAQKAQNEAPAYRAKVSAVEPTSKKAMLITMEVVNPDQLHMKMDMDGKTMMEMATDGKKAYMAQAGGPMTEAPPQVAASITAAKQQASLQAIAGMAKDIKLAGHESVGGNASSIYTFNTEQSGAKANCKMWIGDKDHRPLKVDVAVKGDVAGTQIDQTMSMSFEYDPSIKVTLPNKQ